MASYILKDNLSHNRQKLPTEEKQILKTITNPEYPIDPFQLLGERNFNEPREIPENEIGTPVQEFFRNATIFLTGGTGFMGKVLMEKLLRTCPHIKHIYVLVRPKKGKLPHERMDEVFQDRLFKRVKHEVPKFHHKVSAMNGNVELPGLGLSEEDKQKLSEEVNMIFHGAATVRFDEKLKTAVGINVLGTREIITLAKSIKNLKVIMHVSTAYSFCPHLEIEEKFYEMPVDYEDIIQRVKVRTEEELQMETPKLIGEWPNTYTFTKALAECLIKKEGSDLPISIFRPSVVISTYKEPVRGWIDNVYGPIGIVVGVGTGVLHVYKGNLDMNCPNMVPVDLVVNALICSAKNTAETFKKIESKIPIYLCTNDTQNSITWRKFLEYSEKYGQDWPTIRAIWYYSITVTDNKYLFPILSFLLQTLPGYVLDFLAQLLGKPPRLTKIYQKLEYMENILDYFRCRNWTFKNTNMQQVWADLSPADKKLYNFNMSQMSWEYCFQTMCLGLRVYLLNDDIHTLPAARKKWRRLCCAHTCLKYLFCILGVYITWVIFQHIFL